MKKFTELSHDSFTVASDLTKFCYWYVNLDKINADNENDKRNMIIAEIKKAVIALENA